ncbi:MAG TPA: nuclear transport factor 2 family protein, partial [Candidatus Eisenbacteria bacterium]
MRILFVAVALAGLAVPAAAQTAADSAAIRATALDYIEGWYTGDAARMERALHPGLAKRIVQRNDGSVTLGDMTAE